MSTRRVEPPEAAPCRHDDCLVKYCYTSRQPSGVPMYKGQKAAQTSRQTSPGFSPDISRRMSDYKVWREEQRDLSREVPDG